MLKGQPQVALDTVGPVIAAFEKAQSGEKRRLFCGMTTAQTIAYMGLAASQKQNAVALAPDYCDALFVKGYALVDLGRLPEARATYQRLVELAPMHAHFLAELGQSYRPERNWAKMLELCDRASGYADLSAPERVTQEHGLAWRCMGYALVEQGKFDEAEALYRKCLELDPSDAKAKGELTYIAEQRRKTT
ncbi:tetratricopeptide repeat protein [Sphingomonas sp. PAMC 26605]|uniref:tetratricopeptide repeat protein n=1 Tax=Sphingomonas sp. PAMC 26605 TaxID=1112214 RepID=UPI00026CD73E|nr:tetratricopeptide repeat protein [Sphingomonas sp. PAMC 26605]